MKLEILTTAEVIPAIQAEVKRMAAAGDIVIEMDFEIKDDPAHVALAKRVEALEKLLAKATTGKHSNATASQSASRFDAVNGK